MESKGQPKSFNWAKVSHLVDLVADQITKSGWQPDIIIALSRGGFVPATMLAYRLKVKYLAGLDARKNMDDIRSTGHIVKIRDLSHQKVLIVDDGIITGHLLTIVPDEVRSKGGEPRTCALISEGKCPDPDYLVAVYSKIPQFPWE